MIRYNKAEFGIGFFLYVICIPFCLLYYVLTSYQIISPFLAGYYPYAFLLSLVCIVLLQLGRLFLLKNIKLTGVDFAVLSFVLYASFKIAIDFSLGKYLDDNIKDSFSGLIYFSAVYFIFRTVSFNGRVKICFLVVFLYLFLFSVAFLVSSGVVVLTISRVDGYAASYQYIAMFFILISLPVSAYSNFFLNRVLIYILSIGFLFLNGARTEFVFYLMSIFILELFLLEKLISFFRLLLLFLSSSLALYLSVNYVTAFQDNRVVDLIINFNNTSSGQARARLLEQGKIFIEENIFFGGFPGYKQGEYIHNILSVWVDLGVAGFLLYLNLIFISIFYVFLFIRRSTLFRSDYALVIAVLMPSVIFLIFSKSYSYILFSAALGMASSIRLRYFDVYRSGV